MTLRLLNLKIKRIKSTTLLEFENKKAKIKSHQW